MKQSIWLSKRVPEEERCELLLRGIALYRGDFLSANDSEWAVLLRQYYRTLYLDLCKGVLPLLDREERWTEVISICEQAYQTDFTMEDFTIYRMQALIALGQPEQAIEKYESFRDKRLFRILSVPVAVISLIAFILTEDITLPTGFVDKYTIVMVIIAVVQTVMVALSNKKYQYEEE